MGYLLLNIFDLMRLLFLVNLNLASLYGVADTRNIDGPLALICATIIAVYAALASD